MWERPWTIGDFELDFLLEVMTEVVIQGGGVEAVFGQGALAIFGQLHDIFFGMLGRELSRLYMGVSFFEFYDDAYISLGTGK